MNSNMQWGIGIEHEAMMLYKQKVKLTGQHILTNLKKPIYGLTSYINQFICSKCSYKIARIYDRAPITQLYNHFLKYGINAPLNELLEQHRLLNNISVEITNIEVLENILDELDQDSTNSTLVFEVITVNWKNKLIGEAVDEIKIRQQILINIISTYSDSQIHIATIGAIFPLETNDFKYIIDYTGSYHINLSLPYDVVQLNIEQSTYLRYENRLSNWVKEVLFHDIEMNCPSYLLKYQYYITTNPYDIISHYLNNIFPNEVIDPRFVKYKKEYITLQKSLNNPLIENLFNNNIIMDDVYIQIKYNPLIFQISYLIEDTMYFIKTINVRLIDKVPPFLQRLLQHLINLFDILELPESINTVYLKISKYGVYDVLVTEVKGNSYDTIHDIYNNKPHKLVTYPSLLNKLDKFNKQLVKDPLYQQLIDTEMEQFILKYILHNIIHLFKSNIESSITHSNIKYNILHKYKTHGFHKLHQIWAIGIQWLMPLLLSCYSSSDPLSIGDGDKLTELSLRLFISGYNFINLVDVVNHGLPTDRSIEDWQHEHSNLVDIANSEFLYINNNIGTDNMSFDGSDFRVDSQKGFQFGFELRVFDNFDIHNVNNLVEFLFLLADHVAHEKTTYSVNPFNNGILNNETVRILQQGWNTRISREYLDLIESQLLIKTSDYPDGLKAYTVADTIYNWLQHKYIINGKGVGSYSQYVINRSNKPHHLSNINKVSWETSFNNLIWQPTKPKTSVRRVIENAITKSRLSKKSGTHVDLEQLSELLTHALTSPYSSDIEDIIYALQSFGVIDN